MTSRMTSTETVEVPAVGSYRIEPGESTISFATRHVFGLAPVRGTFALRDGVVHVADPAETSTVRATIAADSIDTGLAARDNTVRSRQYLDVAQHPDITFTADGLAHGVDDGVDDDVDDDSGWVLRGTLTVRGRTGPLDVRIDEVRVLGDRLRLRASAEVDRYAWGVTAMKGMTGRRLRFTLSLSATQVAIA
jgi:polyisoprenoid-binding protein YceI